MTARTALKSSHRRFHNHCRFLLTAAVMGVLVIAVSARAEDRIRFNRDIRPILADNCFECHGPDKAKRQADLRLDQKESALAERDSRRAIVPGDLKNSELIRRVLTDDSDLRMPPVDSGRKLTEKERLLVLQWVQQGGEYERHWSFVAPQRPQLPTVSQADWPQNPIDYFILARLERDRLQLSLIHI